MSTFEKVQAALASQLNIKKERITPETVIKKDLGADSLDLVEILMAFEDEYKINFDEESIERMQTVADVVKIIDELGIK